jgi:hypothetical protein
MNYQNYIGLRAEEQADHTFTYGKYAGTDENGDPIFQLYDFWVTVRENMKGFYFEARESAPDVIVAGPIQKTQEL